MTIKTDGDIIKAIDDALIEADDATKRRVSTWFNSKYTDVAQDLPNQIKIPTAKKSPMRAKPHSAKKSPSTKKSKVIIKRLKELDLQPTNKQTAIDFVAEKQPSNAKQKCVVATYYLANVLELDLVTVSHIFTFFKDLNWPLPADLQNMLSQAGSEAWLDTSSFDNIKVTTRGENLIEHQLPSKKAKN